MKYHPLFTCFANAVKKAKVDTTKICLVSDFLYQPEISEYLGFDLLKQSYMISTTELKIGIDRTR